MTSNGKFFISRYSIHLYVGRVDAQIPLFLPLGLTPNQIARMAYNAQRETSNFCYVTHIPSTAFWSYHSGMHPDEG